MNPEFLDGSLPACKMVPIQYRRSCDFFSNLNMLQDRRLRHVHNLSATMLSGVTQYVTICGNANRKAAMVDLYTLPSRDARLHIEAIQTVVKSAIQILVESKLVKRHTAVFVDEEVGNVLLGFDSVFRSRDSCARSSMVVLCLPPEEFNCAEMEDFSRVRQYRHVTWENPNPIPWTLAERVWARIYDAFDMHNSARFFVVTSYRHWIFGCLSRLRTTAWVSTPICYTETSPSISELICYWYASSRGCPGAFSIPEVAERDHGDRGDMRSLSSKTHFGNASRKGSLLKSSAYLHEARRRANLEHLSVALHHDPVQPMYAPPGLTVSRLGKRSHSLVTQIQRFPPSKFVQHNISTPDLPDYHSGIECPISSDVTLFIELSRAAGRTAQRYVSPDGHDLILGSDLDDEFQHIENIGLLSDF